MQQVYKATDVGLVRKGNEDNLLVFDKVYAVADGMGGEAAGEVASQLLVNTVQEKLAGREQIREAELCQAIQDANMVIRHYVGEHPGCEGMGTTATLLHIDEQDGQAYWAHVGDSRLYIINEDICQITRDHSLVEEMVQRGQLEKDEARTHANKNIITRAIGVDNDVTPEIFSVDLEEGSKILICTDGLTNMVDDGRIQRLVKKGGTVKDITERLVQAAMEGGGKDNITVMVIDPDTER